MPYLNRRDAYARSVASNAMVGHVLGIGDRHSMNILVDCRTGEQVHIDFGIVSGGVLVFGVSEACL